MAFASEAALPQKPHRQCEVLGTWTCQSVTDVQLYCIAHYLVFTVKALGHWVHLVTANTMDCCHRTSLFEATQQAG